MQSIPVDSGLALLAAPCLVSLAAYALAWSLAIGWLAATAGRRHGNHARGRTDDESLAAGLTILKPLCGIDEDLEANLASFFALDHRPLQIVFGAASPNDPALAIARRLARRHPWHDVAFVTSADPEVPNPKVALMESLLPRARHGILLLSDSNVRVTVDEAARVLPDFADPTVGMVYQPVVAVGEETVPAAIENLHYTEYAAFLTIGARLLAGQHTVNAKGQWVRREALEAVGSFTGVRDCGADDYALAELMRRAGWRLRSATDMVRVVQRQWSWGSFARRNLRHAGLRWRICPWAYPLELLFNPIPWTLPLLAGGRVDLTTVAAAVVATKVLLEVTAARLLRGVDLDWRFVPVIPLKDLVVFGCWFVALFARTTIWRDQAYRLRPGGRIEPLANRHVAEPAPALKSAA